MSRLFLFPNHFFCQVSKATNPYELEATKLIIFHIVLPPFPPTHTPTAGLTSLTKIECAAPSLDRSEHFFNWHSS